MLVKNGVMDSMREGKGHSIEKYTGDYCVVDLETTGIFISETDIIEISPQSLFLWDLGFLTTSARLKSKSLRKK